VPSAYGGPGQRKRLTFWLLLLEGSVAWAVGGRLAMLMRHEEVGDGVVEARQLHRHPGAQEHNVAQKRLVLKCDAAAAVLAALHTCGRQPGVRGAHTVTRRRWPPVVRIVVMWGSTSATTMYGAPVADGMLGGHKQSPTVDAGRCNRPAVRLTGQKSWRARQEVGVGGPHRASAPS
jgi:hypothetical protein